MIRRFPSSDPYDGSADDSPVSRLWRGMIIDCLREGDERMHVVPPSGDHFIVHAYRDGPTCPPDKRLKLVPRGSRVD